MKRKKFKQYYGIIYCTINLLNGKIYIGQTIYNNSLYLGSGLLINRAIKKYGKENFKRKISCICFSKKELNFAERYLIKIHQTTNSKIGYNITKGGNGGDTLSNHPNKKEIRQKISLKITGSKRTNQTKKKMKTAIKRNNGPWNKGLTKEIDKSVANMSKKKRGKEGNKGSKNGMYGKPSWCKGLTKETDERVAKISKKMIGNKNGFYKRTKEHCGKISIATKGRISWSKGLTKETDKRIAKRSKTYIGTIWITNEILNKRINKNSVTPEGWRLGKIHRSKVGV